MSFMLLSVPLLFPVLSMCGQTGAVSSLLKWNNKTDTFLHIVVRLGFSLSRYLIFAMILIRSYLTRSTLTVLASY